MKHFRSISCMVFFDINPGNRGNFDRHKGFSTDGAETGCASDVSGAACSQGSEACRLGGARPRSWACRPGQSPERGRRRAHRGSRRIEGGWTVFDKRYWPGDTITGHLTFALRHEPIDLLILKRAFDAIPAEEMIVFIKATPTGVLTRRAWFFYETLTGKTLDLEDAQTVTAADALDPKAYFTGTPQLSKRHRVRDNLLGTGAYCPIIRRTEALEAFLARGLAQKAAETVGRTGGHLIARAASFLLLADSRASFEIEGERPPRNRLERWGRAVLQAGRNPSRSMS